MMPSKMSCMFLLEKMGTMYGKSGGKPLHQEFHYELIFTLPKRTRSLLLMWWLLT
jgi:hypothetical protein